jgi:site-specific recombinase XerD
MVKGMENREVSAKSHSAPSVSGTVRSLAEAIAKDAPTLSSLSPEQLEQIAKVVVARRLASELDTAVTLAGIDYEKERDVFIETAGSTDSPHTRRAYRSSLKRLEEFAKSRGISVFELMPATADDFIYSLRGRAPASIRRDAASCSSFFTFIERRHSSIHNPFRGTRARPKRSAKKELQVPDSAEVKTIIDAIKQPLSAAVSVMAYRGLRVGTLENLSIRGNSFFSRSKGKDISGAVPEAVLTAIKDANLPLYKPFEKVKTTVIENEVIRKTKKLTAAGEIRHPYSCHDFRHFFSVAEYTKDKDLYRVSRLLDHADIQVTIYYLRTLGAIEKA